MSHCVQGVRRNTNGILDGDLQSKSPEGATRCVFEKKLFLKISKYSQENTCARVFLNKVKKRIQHRCFPVKLAKFLRTPILKNLVAS